MIRPCVENDFDAIFEIINDAAKAYKWVIPEDCWKEPYMSIDELQKELNASVSFWGYEEDGQLVGVMGIQSVKDVTLIRHAYVNTTRQNRGIGGQLLTVILRQTSRPILVGTWADASWAIRLYEKYGFRLVSPEEYGQLLRKYWTIMERQIDTSVVLADRKWFNLG